VLDLFRADYTFVNERLARHYDIPGVSGDEFRKVQYPDDTRRGLLGQGAILVQTSLANRTSPVLRGKWVMEVLMGTPPPPPPPDVPILDDTADNQGGRMLTTRERMELHRKNPVCASCHSQIDPLGFALENFDAVGKWRTSSDGAPIDPSATFPDGTRFEGVAGLRTLMASHQEDFVRTLSSKLLAYAIGRGLDYEDMPAVRGIARAAEPSGYTWSSLIAGIVKSTPFSMAVASERAGKTSAAR
jgi:hypothetical protein